MKAFLTIVILAVFLLVSAGCNPVPVDYTPTADTPSLYRRAILTSVTYEERGSRPDYTIATFTPLLTGSDNGRVANFNQQMAALVQGEVDAFKQSLLNLPAEPISMGSSLNITFAQMAPAGNLLSLKFTISYYSDGAAHPGTYSRAATYDLEAGQFVTLDSLFLPGSDYLELISAYCLAQLSASEIGSVLFAEGAQPTAENYRNWNVTTDGLLITFDEYQVAAYAAGPQTVMVPYSELQSILEPQGPLAGLLSK